MHPFPVSQLFSVTKESLILVAFILRRVDAVPGILNCIEEGYFSNLSKGITKRNKDE